MKKVPFFSLERVLMLAGFTLVLGVAGFWHHRQNGAISERMAALQQGIGTCFSRVNQTFTAAMIRDTRSPYLSRDFMALSDECLRDSAKTAGVDLGTLGKAARLHNELVSEAYWFHEKVTKVLAANPLDKTPAPLAAVSEKYGKVEGLRLDLADQIDVAQGRARAARGRDEWLLLACVGMFLFSLAVLGVRELRFARLRRELERQALSLLNTGKANVGAMVDQLMLNCLSAAGMPVTAQVFRDYHGEVMERLGGAPVREGAADTEAASVMMETAPLEIAPAPLAASAATREAGRDGVADMVSLRPLLTTVATRMGLPMDAQDGQAAVDGEALAQVIQSMGMRLAGWDIRLVGERSERGYNIRLLGDGVCLNSAELEYASNVEASLDGVDLNLVQALELARGAGIVAHARNRRGADGSIAGAELVLELPLVAGRTLNQVMSGKKRDLVARLRGDTHA